MWIRFHRDADTDLPHIHSHGVTENEVISVFRRSRLRLSAKRGAQIALGQTSAGRYLKVIYRDEEDGLFVITAYDLRGKELKAYRRRRRKES